MNDGSDRGVDGKLMRHSFDPKCQYTLRLNSEGCTGHFLGDAKSAREQSHWRTSSNRNLTTECAIEAIKLLIENEGDIKSSRMYILSPLRAP